MSSSKTAARAARIRRTILHVHVVDDLSGRQLVDVDVASTAEGLAYYLESRRIDEAATEAGVAGAIYARQGRRPADTETIAVETRGIGTGNLELALVAHVEGSTDCKCPRP